MHTSYKVSVKKRSIGDCFTKENISEIVSNYELNIRTLLFIHVKSKYDQNISSTILRNILSLFQVYLNFMSRLLCFLHFSYHLHSKNAYLISEWLWSGHYRNHPKLGWQGWNYDVYSLCPNTIHPILLSNTTKSVTAQKCHEFEIEHERYKRTLY